VSIAVECPHCETRFHLQPELAGKTMRCPNPDCRKVFEVAAALPPLPMMPRDETPAPAAAQLPPEPQVVDAQLAPAPKPRPKPTSKPKPRRAVVDAAAAPKPPAADGPREVVWQPDADLPPAPPPPVRAAAATPAFEPVDDDYIPIRRRKRRGNRGPIILLSLFVLIGIVGGVVGVFLLRYGRLSQEQAVARADGLYKEGKFGESKRAFDELAAKYPDHADAEKYRFFADLSAMRAAVGSVTNRQEPRPALAALRAFIDARKTSEFAKPDQAFGDDIYQAGKKVADDVAGYATDRVSDYQKDRAKTELLRQAEEMIAEGRALPPLVEPFRPKEATGFTHLAELDKAEAGIKQARYRLGVIDEVRKTLASGTEQAVTDAKAVLAAAGLADDPEGRDLISRAEADFVRRVRYDPDPAAPAAPAEGGIGSLVFVAPAGAEKAVVREPTDAPPTVFLAVARGVLYALDEPTGDLLWAARVGADVFDPPAVAKVETAEGPVELAVVLANVAVRPEAVAYTLRGGQPKWRQPLPAAAAGAAAIVEGRAFVPVRDAVGTVVVLDLATGARVGRITLGQAAGPAVARPGTTELYVAADARRVFVFDAAAPADDGGRRPRCVRVMPTNHPPGSVRTAPVILGPAGDAPAPRHLLLCQASGPAQMTLRVFPVVNTPLPAGDAPPVAEPFPPAAELAVPGWVWFPPVSDGERLAAVTDAGQFRLFGVNLPGNSDPALFALAAPQLPTPPDGAPVPGLAVPAEDGAFWVLAGGVLQKFRLSLHPVRGLELVGAGAGEAVGAPTQPVQLNARRDTACFVVRSGGSAGSRAVAVRLRDGEPLWRRQLGLLPGGPAVRTATGVLLADEDGGAVHIPAAAVGAKAADPAWVVATSPGAATGPTAVAAGPDGLAFTLTPTATEKGPRWVVRTFSNGALQSTGAVAAPAAPAGNPIVFHGALLVPAANGQLFRVTPGDGKGRADTITPGPAWLLDRRIPDPVCHLVALDGDSFAASDGGKALVKWVWPTGSGYGPGNARWELRDKVATAPLFVPAANGRPARFLAAEATGGVWLFPADRGGEPARKWLPGRTVGVPGGRVGAFALGAKGVCYAVEGKGRRPRRIRARSPRPRPRRRGVVGGVAPSRWSGRRWQRRTGRGSSPTGPAR
jgi:outer membrane protein assembly factor BamB